MMTWLNKIPIISLFLLTIFNPFSSPAQPINPLPIEVKGPGGVIVRPLQTPPPYNFNHFNPRLTLSRENLNIQPSPFLLSLPPTDLHPQQTPIPPADAASRSLLNKLLPRFSVPDLSQNLSLPSTSDDHPSDKAGKINPVGYHPPQPRAKTGSRPKETKAQEESDQQKQHPGPPSNDLEGVPGDTQQQALTNLRNILATMKSVGAFDHDLYHTLKVE